MIYYPDCGMDIYIYRMPENSYITETKKGNNGVKTMKENHLSQGLASIVHGVIGLTGWWVTHFGG